MKYLFCVNYPLTGVVRPRLHEKRADACPCGECQCGLFLRRNSEAFIYGETVSMQES